MSNIFGILSLTPLLLLFRGLALVFLWAEGSEWGLEQNLSASSIYLGFAFAPTASSLQEMRIVPEGFIFFSFGQPEFASEWVTTQKRILGDKFN